MHKSEAFLSHLDCDTFAARLRKLIHYPEGLKFFNLAKAVSKLSTYGYEVAGIPLMTNYIEGLAKFIESFPDLS